MPQGYTNDFSSTLTSAFTSGGTSMSIATVTGLPASGLSFYLQVDNEYFLCTSYSGTTLTVAGAQQSSTAASHASGSTVTGCWFLPAVIDGIRADQSQTGTVANLPTANPKAGDMYWPSNCINAYRYNGSSWDSWGPVTKWTPPVLANYAWDSQGSATATQLGAAVSMYSPGNSGDNEHSLLKSVTVPYTLTMGFIPTMRRSSGNNDYVGISLSDGTKYIYYVLTNIGSLAAYRYSNRTTFVSGGYEFTTESWPYFNGQVCWLQVVNNGSTRIYNVSADGFNFVTIASVSYNSYLTETKAGMLCGSGSGTAYPVYMTVVSWSGV
jgi:hypothetical protein